jgi:SAM-dependent methyltransferase
MAFDRLIFGLMYRIGFTPWEGHKLPTRLRNLIEGETALAKGKALEVGCGTGNTSIYLARNGWDVTGVDFVNRAIQRARMKTEAAGVSVRYIRADVTQLGAYGVGTGFHLVSDSGCMHGLSGEGRDAYVKELSAIVVSGGRLILAGFAEGKRRGPRGFNRPEIERRFAGGWEIVEGGEDVGISNMPNDPIYVYDLRRR